jgi:hypothetical protein
MTCRVNNNSILNLELEQDGTSLVFSQKLYGTYEEKFNAKFTVPENSTDYLISIPSITKVQVLILKSNHPFSFKKNNITNTPEFIKDVYFARLDDQLVNSLFITSVCKCSVEVLVLGC